MYVEYRNGNGSPWIADPHHTPTAESTCLQYSPNDLCEFCKAGNPLKCTQGYVSYNQVSATGRNYWLFGLLANVRCEGPRDARGLPEDVSDMIKAAAEADGDDGHSHSFISLEDFKTVLFKELNEKVSDWNNNKENKWKEEGYKPTDRYDAFYDWSKIDHKDRPPEYTTLVTYCEKLIEEKSVDRILLQDESLLSEVQVRLVFWFDN